jgi:hypothetical protein
MKEQFVPYELALKLKELGFDEECFSYYHNRHEPSWVKTLHRGDTSKNSVQNLYQSDCASPLFQQAFRWFRKKKFLIDVTSLNSNEYEFYIQWSFAYSFLSDIYKTYEEAELACLDKLIEILELEQKNK